MWGHGATPTYLIIHFLCAVGILAVEVVATMTHSRDKLRKKKRAIRMSNTLKPYQPAPPCVYAGAPTCTHNVKTTLKMLCCEMGLSLLTT